MSRDEIAGLLREKYPYLNAEYGIMKIGLFGSYARDSSCETSDVDIVVEFQKPIGFKFVELAEYLENLLGRKVDVLTPAGIQGIRVAHIAADIEGSILYV
jgi:hypothetical protein